MSAAYKPLNLNFEGHVLTLSLNKPDAGAQIFCTDGGLKEPKDMHNWTWPKQPSLTAPRTRHLLACAVPVISAANQTAYGGACEGAVTVDLPAAADPARFALNERNEGNHLFAGGRQSLGPAWGVRQAKAKAIHLTGLAFNARGGAVLAFNETCQPAFTEQRT